MACSRSKSYVSFFQLMAFPLALVAAIHANASESDKKLPKGWTPMSAKTITGDFLGDHKPAIALLVRSTKEKQYGVAVLPGESGVSTNLIVTKFKDIDANLPELTVFVPGVVKPVCHNGTKCEPVNVRTDALSLCFGEASCEVIYFDGKRFRTVFATD